MHAGGACLVCVIAEGGKMRRTVLLCLVLTLAGSFLAAGSNSSQTTDTFPAFWREFKRTVISRDEQSVIRLTKFPIGISNDAKPVQNRAEMKRRFSEIFDQHTNAAKCFSEREPSQDTESPNRYTISCPNKDDNFVVYEFERTNSGWKFVHRQFPTKCSCR